MAISNNFNKQLPKIRECFAKHPVERAWLFGSFSRGEERPDSDVDFLVEYTPKENLSLLEIAGLWRSLHDLLGREVDVVENGYLMPYAEKTANNDKILIYERTAKR
ncbi:MAG: nucleotidyltransferase domain-containing protein [Bacteroidaceae bacterium]|nr:nucleotidyltransferase domain-containing protein [Bacteroidaceae bacterium]